MQPADRSWTRPATEAGKRDHPANSLEREPPLKPQFEQAKASTKPLEPPQPDPAKVRADQRQARRTQNFEGSRLAKAPVVTNAFERANDNLRQPVRPRPAPERPVARDNGLREAFKQVEAKPGPQRAPEPVKQPTPERNWARGLNRPAQPQATPQPKPEPAREQAVKPEFNRASQGQAERGQAREQSGSQMVRESQPKHLMQPPPEMRREPDRKDHNDRLAEERTREAARQAAREADQRERDGRQGPQPPGPERSR